MWPIESASTGIVGAGQDVQTVVVQGEEQLDRGGVDLGGAGQLRQRVLRRQRQRRRQVAELHVEVDGDHPARMPLGESDREVGGDGGLAGAALGRDHDDDLGLA